MKRLRLYLNKRATEIHGIELYSPTIEQIDSIGELQYNIHLAFATFNKEMILRTFLSLTDEEYDEVSKADPFEMLVQISWTKSAIAEALTFFLRNEVRYEESSQSYKICSDDGTFLHINAQNYQEIAKTICLLNGIDNDMGSKKAPITKRAKQMKAELNKFRAQAKKNMDSSLELKDILSILCNSPDNGINIFNVANLTIYQVYEHFERLNINELHTRMLKVWANGYLAEGQQLPEKMIKSKL